MTGAPPPAFAGVLRLPPGRVRVWAIGLFFIGLALIVGAPLFGYHDWPAFWTAGNLVGSPEIVSFEGTIAWQRARGMSLAVFPYPPAVGYAFLPFALLPLGVAFWVHALAMVGCAIAAGVAGARAFGLPTSMGVLATLAWAPVTGAIAIGQNTPFALLLAALAILWLVEERTGWAGAVVGFLGYKPTLALPLAGLLVLRRRWIDAGVVIATGLVWYAVGVVATGGDLRWPVAWVDLLGQWLADDTAANADKAVSLPGLVDRLGVPDWVPLVVGGAMVVVALPRLIRAPLREAAVGALLIGVAASPHAWGYEAALLVPFVWWALAGGLAEPWRTRLIVAAYLIVPLWMVSSVTQVSAVAFVVIGAYVIWVAGLFRPNPTTAAPTKLVVRPA